MSNMNVQVISAESELQLVVFRLAQEEYGLPITKVQEINRLVPVTKLPKTPLFMEGIINLRGQIIPIIDLRKRFQLAAQAHDDDSRILIVDVNGKTVGLVVDHVAEVIHLKSTEVEPAPTLSALESEYINGIGKFEGRLLILLNVDSILTSQEDSILRDIKKEF